MKKANFAVLTILLFSLFAALTLSQSGGMFVVQKSIIAGGGGTTSGGMFIVDGTIGQPFGGSASTGGTFSETGGFWSADPAASGSPTPTPGASISGTVTYGNAAVPPKFISNVTVTGTGSPNVSAFTGAPGMTAGQYSLTGFGAGSYTVTLSKTTGQNSITSNDAARIAQHVAGISLLTTNNQKVSADVSGNGILSSNDAAKIAQVVAGLPFSPPNLTGQWRFYVPPGPTFPVGASPTSRTYASVTSNIAGDDYIGLLLGEVTGNWAPSAARPATGPMSSTKVQAPNLVTSADEYITIPISVQGAAEKGIISYQFNLRYDPLVIQPQKDAVDIAKTLSRGFSVVANAEEPGLLRVVVYGAIPIGPIDGDGVLLNLRFNAVGSPGSISPLLFDRIMFNEGDPRVTTTDGQVKLF